ncbi:hypothetical protein [Flavobacterium taihuense]|uniref:YD repeat-containing protein n=1 Tax=Flavobacterium taihuense TaxID=2857508 RepID=A0ABS6Y1D3_9FLAO|nr:hypothetical protein [Flavobacterium taihuense]MBW4362740.1 hypothetical protein [Flavobacterium taihuense]
MNRIKNLFIISLMLLINPAFSQISDASLKSNPMLELLGANAKTMGLKGDVTQMQVQQFSLDAKGNKIADSLTFSNLYKFDKDGLTKEFEENYTDFQSKKYFFSYTNKGYVSHIDIETNDLSKDKDTSDTNLANQAQTSFFSTIDYKYVKKKNILYKGQENIEGELKKTNTRNEYFYHFNDNNQIVQIDYQSTDLVTKYIYDPNGMINEIQTLKSGVLLNKNICKYDRNNRLIHIITIKANNNTKYPNEEISINYKLDNNGNIIEKKTLTYLYTKGTKDFFEGYLHLYNYTY